MSTSHMIRELCKKQGISISELARKIGQSPQNFSKKLQRGTVSSKEMLAIAKALGIRYEQRFIMADGTKIGIGLND